MRSSGRISALASLVCACAAAAPTPAPSSAEVTIAYVFSAMFLDGLDCTLYDESTSADADGCGRDHEKSCTKAHSKAVLAGAGHGNCPQHGSWD